MKYEQSLARNFLSPASFLGQGIVVARKRSRSEWSGSGTTDSPVFLRSKKCPKHKSRLIQTKNHRIEIINEDGKEEIRVETAQGQMRAILSKKGIELVNELDGGIEVSGKKINLKGKNVTVVAEKSLSMNSDGPANFKEKGKFTLTSDKDVTLKGKNIKMSGSKGVAAEGKQIAVQDDKVMGFDVHIMVVPSGNGTTTVPLPHPFIGKLADKLSKDVKIKDKSCATKDSVAKHDDTMHMQQWAIGSWCNAKKQF